VTKGGSIFLIWTGIVFLTDQVFLLLNGQMESLLVCNWLHSVGQNHFHVIMLLNRDSVIFRVFIFRVILLEDSA
jgi:hypothetical protein